MASGNDNPAARILVVDDDPGIQRLLKRYLDEQGFTTAVVGDGKSMDQWLQQHQADLIILDLMLPGEDGLSLARRLRVSGNTPIIMLTARGEEVDRIIGLEMGADDYLPKPFNPRELLARIRAVLRRGSTAVEQNDSSSGESFLFGDFSLDPGRRILFRQGQEVGLTSGEIELLVVLVQHPNRVLSRDQIMDLLNGGARDPFDRSIDVRITRLRSKIEPNPAMPRFIRTVWGKGYRFTPKGTLEG
jgi:DNA-binding response OmpR family regulator